MTSRTVPVFAAVLAVSGVAHFGHPRSITQLTRVAFPRDTRRHVTINGILETSLGVALATPRLRRPGALGASAYFAYLAVNGINAASRRPYPVPPAPARCATAGPSAHPPWPPQQS